MSMPTNAPQCKGWVYFAQHGDADGEIKIGTTAVNPHNRLRSLQTGAPKALRLLAAIPGGPDEERGLHERFKAHRLRPDGEWFRASPEILAFIDGAKWVTPQPEENDHEEERVFGLDFEQVIAIAGFALAELVRLEVDDLSMEWGLGRSTRASAEKLREKLLRYSMIEDQVIAMHGDGEGAPFYRGASIGELGAHALDARKLLDEVNAFLAGTSDAELH